MAPARRNVATLLPTRRPAAPFAEVPDPCVVVIDGPRLGHCIHVHGVPVIVGREPEADFQILDPSVSRAHCTIWQENGNTLLRDLRSKNGTLVNGEYVARAELQEGDLITLGDVVLKFVSGRLEARYHEALFGLATLDTLTGLLNRRHFRALLDEAVTGPGVDGVVVAFIDVDHFKRVNDVHGHDEGDQRLRSIATLIQQTLRPGDAAGRLGGDEFAVLLRDSSAHDARTWADGLRAAVHDLAGAPTVSVGLAVAGSGDVSVANLLHAADLALLEAKRAGRDTVRGPSG
jgi:diguanylate cyclase (GGDEF)-like protein